MRCSSACRGNPVAVMLTFPAVRPSGAALPVRRPLADTVDRRARARVALRKRPVVMSSCAGSSAYDDAGRLTVGPSGAQGSGILTSMSRANCFILLDEHCAGVSEGDVVRVEPFATSW